MTDALTSFGPSPRLTQYVWDERRAFDPSMPHVVGVLLGEGVGTEVVPIALELLDMLRERSDRNFDIRVGGEIGYPAKAVFGQSLSAPTIEFSSKVFDDKGALFCGPGGDRFVYDLRRTFDLFCKFTPLVPFHELRHAGTVRPETVDATNIIAVRENMGGIYQGEWSTEIGESGDALATHSFQYAEADVRRILAVALGLAADRKKRLHVVLKPGGIPSISQLWRECVDEMAEEYGVTIFEVEIDNAVYQLIANPGQFDVIVSPNMMGDILADCGSLLLASRGLSYSGNFNEQGHAAYQTGHGAARDISGRDVVNPIGQVLSLGMMLRESFDWVEADTALRLSIRDTLRAGFFTRDIAVPGGQILGTRAFAEKLKTMLSKVLKDRSV